MVDKSSAESISETTESMSSDEENNSVYARQGEAWSEVTPLGRDTFRVRLGGSFRSAWMAALCTGLADRRISILQVHARREHGGAWIAELTVVPLSNAPDPRNVPYVDLAMLELTLVPTPLRLDVCTVVDSHNFGGSLRLEFHAEDTLGLLGSVLASLATLMLFPIEMHIETQAGRAHDVLWLSGMGSSVPSTHAAEALRRLLPIWKRT